MDKFLAQVVAVVLGTVIAGAASAEVQTGDPLIESHRIAAPTYDFWDKKAVFKSRYLWQNVAADDVVELLAGHTTVFYAADGGRSRHSGAIRVSFYDGQGVAHNCVVDHNNGKPGPDGYGAINWYPVTFQSAELQTQYPLLGTSGTSGATGWKGYANIQYNGTTGQMAYPIHDGRQWWDYIKGHLQDGIPAATYDVCPDFPSAESLGTFVNTRQTSWNYFELVQQDPGQRIIRPDLVTINTPTYYFPADGN